MEIFTAIGVVVVGYIGIGLLIAGAMYVTDFDDFRNEIEGNPQMFVTIIGLWPVLAYYFIMED